MDLPIWKSGFRFRFLNLRPVVGGSQVTKNELMLFLDNPLAWGHTFYDQFLLILSTFNSWSRCSNQYKTHLIWNKVWVIASVGSARLAIIIHKTLYCWAAAISFNFFVPLCLKYATAIIDSIKSNQIVKKVRVGG